MYYMNDLCNEVDYTTRETDPSLLNISVGSCTSPFNLTNNERRQVQWLDNGAQ